ncbi:MAG: type II toxin-antitoxin system Phd/YefM family antitoxin [Spirochaetota bacterium]
MIDINTHAAKTKLSQLLSLVEIRHERIRICRNGKPVAMLVPVEETVTDPMQKHPELSEIRFFGDPTEPIDVEDWPENMR